MRSFFALMVGVVLATSVQPATAVGGPERIEIPLAHGTLKAVIYRPEGAGPFPAVIGLHGCGGLNNRNGTLATRYQDWAERLSQGGYAVMLPDSYGSRGLATQCSVRARSVRTERERVADVNAARVWLQTQPYVAGDRISLLGWSNGGITALWAVRARTAVRDGTADFRSAVALYPGCRRLGNAAWSGRVPTLILIGRADDQTSAAACEQMVAGARGRSARVEIRVYPGAHHDFDHPNRPMQVRTGYAFSADGSGRVHSGTNPNARADALKRVSEWFAQ